MSNPTRPRTQPVTADLYQMLAAFAIDQLRDADTSRRARRPRRRRLRVRDGGS